MARILPLVMIDDIDEAPSGAAPPSKVVELLRRLSAEDELSDKAAKGWTAKVKAWQPGPAPEPTEIMHAVQGLIRAGKVGALVAAGGTGKTTMLLTLAVCHATGRDFFGCEVVRGTFVLLSNDDPQEDLEQALVRVMLAMRLTDEECDLTQRHVRLHSLQGEAGTKTFTVPVAGAILPTGLEVMMQDALSGIPDLVGIAIDTLRQFSGGSSNDETVIKLTIQGATELALKTGAYVVLPHHTGKQNFRDGIVDQYAGSGSAAIADNCRFIMVLQTTTWADIENRVTRTGQENGDPLVLTSTRGSLLMRAAEPIFIVRDGFLMSPIAGAAKSQERQEFDKDLAILRAVRDGHQTKNTIFHAVKGGRNQVFARVDDMISQGLLVWGGTAPNGSRGTTLLLLTSEGSRLLITC